MTFRHKSALLLLACSVWLSAADKKLPIEETSNELVDVTASLLDKDQIHQEFGDSLDPSVVVVRVTVHPLTDKPVQLSRDGFLLVSNKDGQRSEPFAPGQIAGGETIAETPDAGHGVGAKHGRPSFEGIGLGGSLGSSPGGTRAPDFKAHESRDAKPNPLLDALKQKELPEKQITDTASGLLYFQSVGKVKPKDLELHLKGIGSPLALRFHP
ncbi:MAG TPA: hypothetical protein VMB25_07580 [Bryobacteraceae bacterium]|nr:hypothetical protein [Bryobacteraceae bacterium]